MQEYAKHIAQQMLSTFLWSICKKKKNLYILKPYQEIGQVFEECLRGGKLVKKLQMF